MELHRVDIGVVPFERSHARRYLGLAAVHDGMGAVPKNTAVSSVVSTRRWECFGDRCDSARLDWPKVAKGDQG